MDLSVPDDMEPENESVQPAEAPKEAKSVAENSGLEEDLLAKVKQLKHLFGIPDDLERKIASNAHFHSFMKPISSIEKVA